MFQDKGYFTFDKNRRFAFLSRSTGGTCKITLRIICVYRSETIHSANRKKSKITIKRSLKRHWCYFCQFAELSMHLITLFALFFTTFKKHFLLFDIDLFQWPFKSCVKQKNRTIYVLPVIRWGTSSQLNVSFKTFCSYMFYTPSKTYLEVCLWLSHSTGSGLVSTTGTLL